jgi:uncharacterized protein YmfQ (DUF2313 family)
MYGVAWANAWAINAPLESISYARFGTSRFGEPYASWSNAVLECEITGAAPAHTKVLFRYT